VGEVYEVTGPRLLMFAEAVAEIARAAGLAAEGVPDDEAALLRYLFTDVLDGLNARITGGVQRPRAAAA
jgi:uncharacterized protein YbjT (DUF2867 family)